MPRIRTLALRLIAGQKPSGGWDYYCPMLNKDDELGLLALLYKDRPTNQLDLFAREKGKNAALEGEMKREEPKRDGDLYRPRPSKAPPLELFIARNPRNANSNYLLVARSPETGDGEGQQRKKSGLIREP